jgi:outer membrane protein OmpA-like peptidoglycan-associated protein
MRSKPSLRAPVRAGLCSAVLWALLASSAARAQNQGFTVNRYEPTAAGEWSFWVDHPWYSRTRYFAAGLTLNYGHNPLVFGRDNGSGFTQTATVIEHQLLGHLDVAGSFLDRVTLNLSLPITLLESGNPTSTITPQSGTVGDPRLGFMVRLWGQPDESPISINLGANFYIPLRAITGDSAAVTPTSSDTGVRILPRLVLAGFGHHIRWSTVAGFLFRPEAVIGGSAVAIGTGSEIQLGVLVNYADKERRFAVGPEVQLSTLITGGQTFGRDSTSIEVLLGGHYNIARLVQVGLAAGLGALRQPGTPDARVLLRLAYAPIRSLAGPSDRDHDGILDKEDACPDEPGVRADDPLLNGCPLRDRDGDGVLDREDLCPDVHKGSHPDPLRLGCPLGDRDSDGVSDRDDLCPDVPMGPHPDPQRLGCPLSDRDQDGVFDRDDLCPDVPQGEVPDPQRPGCPAGDRDKDGWLDPKDQCPDVPAGIHPDPQRPGCPDLDRDGDSVPDRVDACPDKPGAPHPDPKKNGCPSLVTIKDGKLTILRPVFFATNQDVILPQSFPVLQAVTDAVQATPEIRRIAIEGHTDNRGKVEYNTDLSDRRARSVVRWLTEHGIAAERLSGKGYGPSRPIADNRTAAGRAANRRVEFIIVDPPMVRAAEPVQAPVIIDRDPNKPAPRPRRSTAAPK